LRISDAVKVEGTEHYHGPFRPLFLKHPLRWRLLRLGDQTTFRVKYMAEGRCNYIFRIKDDGRLLRITRRQFYAAARPVDADAMAENGRIMNSLAGVGLSVRTEHVYGGALLVEHAGARLRRRHLQSRQALVEVFAGLKDWSMNHGSVILDYNEGNWCCRDGVIRLVDVDVNFMCALDEIGAHPLVQRRVSVEGNSSTAVLEAFLREEERLLWNHLAQRSERVTA
jgi:hypothetical protein